MTGIEESPSDRGVVPEKTGEQVEQVILGSDSSIDSEVDYDGYQQKNNKVKWYRSTFYNATILGLCNFLAPGLWGAMNSLGAGGLEKPYLVNAANALTFGLMFVTCLLGSAAVKLLGVRQVLALGTAGYAPYAAALYCNNRYGVEWFVIFGAALCGLTAGVFWMSEAAIALSYPEPERKGQLMGYWLMFRVGGNFVGGIINLALNVHRDTAGKVSYNVYIVFIILQALGPFVAFLLTPPDKVERIDGRKVQLHTDPSVLTELKETLKFFLRKDFLLLIPLISQAVWSEAFTYTYLDVYFTVRARALGSLLSAVCAMLAGNILGFILDSKKLANKSKARYVFIAVIASQLAWWVWSTVNQQKYQGTGIILDWVDPGFGKAFGLYIFLVIGFQLNYMYLYYIIGNLATSPQEIIRLAALLRGVESAAQAVSYGLNSVKALITVGNSAINFGITGLAVVPAALVIWKIGVPGGIGPVQPLLRSDEESAYRVDSNEESDQPVKAEQRSSAPTATDGKE